MSIRLRQLNPCWVQTAILAVLAIAAWLVGQPGVAAALALFATAQTIALVVQRCVGGTCDLPRGGDRPASMLAEGLADQKPDKVKELQARGA